MKAFANNLKSIYHAPNKEDLLIVVRIYIVEMREIKYVYRRNFY